MVDDRPPLWTPGVSRGWRCIAWLVFGPVASAIAAYFTLLSFLLLGAGGDIDAPGTPFQDFLNSIVAPTMIAVFTGGSLFSICMAILPFLRGRR